MASAITLLSDLGENNFSVAGLQYFFTEAFPARTVLNLYHQSDSFDIESLAYQLYGALHTFPEYSIHVLFCKKVNIPNQLLISKIKNQYVISPNNGILSVLHEEINTETFLFHSTKDNYEYQGFVQEYIQLIQWIESGEYSHKLDKAPNILQMKPLNTGLMISEDRIIARVIAILSTGNIVLNLKERDFNKVVSNQRFYIQFLTIRISHISNGYQHSNTNNKMGALFNEAGFLEIFMIGGSVAELFNINKYTNNKIEIVIGDSSNSQVNF